MLYFTLKNLLYKIGIYSEGTGDNIKGIDGWLFLALIRLALYPLFIIHEMVTYIFPLTSPEIWSALTDESSRNYNSLWVPYVIFALTSKIFLILFSAYVVYFFIKKSQRLPNLMINFLITSICIMLIEMCFAGSILSSATDGEMLNNALLRSIVVSVIWIFYFLKSKRVKNTFTNIEYRPNPSINRDG